MSYPPIVCMTDCTDPNSTARLSARLSALTNSVPAMVPLPVALLPQHGADTEAYASVTLLDTLMAMDRLGQAAHPIIIILNTAPRDGQWDNGVPFCYFWYRGHLVVSTFSRRALSLVRRHLGITHVELTDVRRVMQEATKWTTLTSDDVDYVTNTQFRSLWYQLLLAQWVHDERAVPAETTAIPLADDEDAVLVAVIDAFDNAKTNRTGKEIGFVLGDSIKVPLFGPTGRQGGGAEVRCYAGLRDVPVGKPGLIIGSSGPGFVELVVGCGSAADHFGVRQGTVLWHLG